MDEEAGNGPLFEGVVFAVMPGDGIDDIGAHEIAQSLEAGGGRQLPLRASDNSIESIGDITHLISTHVDFPQYNRALELGIFVVKPSWIAQCCRRKRQISTRQYSPDPSQFFQNVVVSCADIPSGDGEAIVGGVIAMGGQHSAKMSKLVTHIVTNSMEHHKINIAKANDLKCVIVLPHWFHACFTLGKKINERPYELPDPEVFQTESRSGIKIMPSLDLEGAISPSPSNPATLPTPTSPSRLRKSLSAFKGKKVFLANDLQLSQDIIAMLSKVISKSEGAVTTELDDANIFIGKWREGEEYMLAARAGKEVASLAWLYHVINHNRYTSPLRRLFHYPLPHRGIRGFQHMKISLSNYSGDARIYVENLIHACGAAYTRTMKQDNTHLITAHLGGEKCEAAREWNIHVINHLWLEESYSKCELQTMSNVKYSHFPTRTNLGEVAGQTALDMPSVEKYYYPKPRSPQKQVLASDQSHRANLTASGTVHNPLNVIERRGLHEPEPARDTVDVNAAPSPATAKKARGRPPRSAVASPRIPNEGKENESPLPSTGRASKLKALDSIHESREDIANFQREMKQKGGVTHGRRCSSVADETSPAPQRTSKKRPSNDYDLTACGSDLSDGETQQPLAKQAKKAKTGTSSALPPVRYRMIVTGDERWANNAKKESADKQTLRSLGVQLTQDTRSVDIVVAPKILRTKKFICALACAPIVADLSFLDTALSKKKLMEKPPVLSDKESETRLGFKLVDALHRARVNKHNLFRGWTIFVTEEINGGFDTYKEIIAVNGGAAMMYKGRSVTITQGHKGNDRELGEEGNEPDADSDCGAVYLVSGKTDKEIKLWTTFRENAARQSMHVRIVTSDWLLNAAMSQMITLDKKWLMDEDIIGAQDGI